MNIGTFIDLGTVTNLHLAGNSHMPDALRLTFQCAGGERKYRTITPGAACMIWHYLTKILYPRAAASLTPRAATAVMKPGPSASTIFAVKVMARSKTSIEIVGISAADGWSIRCSYDEAQALWACLDTELHLSRYRPTSVI